MGNERRAVADGRGTRVGHVGSKVLAEVIRGQIAQMQQRLAEAMR